MSLTQELQWVAAYTSARAEKVVTARISSELRLETYLPLRRLLRKWSDRMKYVQVPLIPSYTFIKMKEFDLWRVREIKGICGFVSFKGTGIAVIPEQDIVNMRRFADAEEAVYVRNVEQLKVGSYVKVIDGTFAGMTGVIAHDCEAGNFAVEISGLNIYLTATINQDLLQSIDAPENKPVGLLYK